MEERRIIHKVDDLSYAEILGITQVLDLNNNVPLQVLLQILVDNFGSIEVDDAGLFIEQLKDRSNKILLTFGGGSNSSANISKKKEVIKDKSLELRLENMTHVTYDEDSSITRCSMEFNCDVRDGFNDVLSLSINLQNRHGDSLAAFQNDIYLILMGKENVSLIDKYGVRISKMSRTTGNESYYYNSFEMTGTYMNNKVRAECSIRGSLTESAEKLKGIVTRMLLV